MSKKLTDEEKPVELRTRLPKWLDDKLAARAKQRCQTKSAAVRELVQDAVAQEN